MPLFDPRATIGAFGMTGGSLPAAEIKIFPADDAAEKSARQWAQDWVRAL